jgi:hypothetical protein
MCKLGVQAGASWVGSNFSIQVVTGAVGCNNFVKYTRVRTRWDR